MDNKKQIRIGRFDQVRLLTTKNVSYLSAPPDIKPSPKGLWSVVSILEEKDLLLAQKSVLIRIPAVDVLMVAGYNINKMTRNLGRLSHGEEGKKGSTDSRDPRATGQPD
jgi:hypothetical protein